MKEKWIAASIVAVMSAGLAYGFMVGLHAMEPGGPTASMEDGLDPDGGRGCRQDAGSSVPYPESGAIALSKKEASVKASESSFASGSAPKGQGEVSMVNEDSEPASASLVDEDGKPVAKAFLRPGQSAVLPVGAGAYDVMVESGLDWTGQGFGACARRFKAKGIAVVDPEQASHVVLFGNLAFVMANRLPADIGRRLLEDERRGLREREAGKAASGAALARPGREDRPG